MRGLGYLVRGFPFSLSFNIMIRNKHRNAGVFDGASPNILKVAQDIKEDASLWCMAVASGLREVWPS